MSAKPAQRRKRRNASLGRSAAGLVKMVAVMAVLLALVLVAVRLFAAREPVPDTFCEGLYVNGISLGGMTYEEGLSTVQGQVNKRLHEDSYLLTYGDRQWVFTPSEFNAALDLTEQVQLAWNFGHTGTAAEMRQQADYVRENPIRYEVDIEYDTVLMDDFLTSIKETIDVEPVSASVVMEEDEILTVLPSQNGLTLSLGGLRNTLRDAIMNGETTPIALKPTVAEPEYTTEELKANTQLIASYRTSTKESSSTRNKNIARALRSFNGVTFAPGETASFNQIVGKRTLANGFFEWNEYDGASVVTGVGGGTCQASTTLYGALLKADVDVVLRSPHTMTVGYVKPSMDAAVSASKDLRFTNNLPYPIYIYTNVDSQRAQVNIYGPPCQYDIKLEYEIVNVIEPQGIKTVKDKTGKHVYLATDDMVLKTEGKNGMRSCGYRAYYDKQSGKLIERELLSTDTYYALKPIYWVGTHIE